ncbi:hypothetical protein XENOCAPTIV_024857 [Xenoophorus captivus]|uniref:Uncharacterized protein n=1 Tax=Xenoophorus captivus TaxID=1517983 RepID=A0ABV0QKN6_9TELE
MFKNSSSIGTPVLLLTATLLIKIIRLIEKVTSICISHYWIVISRASKYKNKKEKQQKKQTIINPLAKSTYPCRMLVPISSSLLVRGGVHPGQVASPSQGNTETHRTNNHTHTHSYLRAT